MAIGLTLAACGGDPREPTDLGDGPDRPTGMSGGTSALIGTWQTTLVTETEIDVQTTTTDWQFDASGACVFDQSVQSFSQGTTTTKHRTCRYLDRSSAVEVTYDDDGATSTLPYSVPLNNTQKLVIEGVEYDRIA